MTAATIPPELHDALSAWLAEKQAPSAPTVAVTCAAWIEALRAKRPALRPQTVVDYVSAANHLARNFGDLPVSELDGETLQRWMAEQGMSATRRKSLKIMWGTFAKFVARRYGVSIDLHGLIGATAKELREERHARGDTTLPPEAARAMIEHAPLQLRTAIVLMLGCGCGPSQAAALKREEWDGDWITGIRTKTAAPFRAPVWPGVRRLLERTAGERWLLEADDGGPLIIEGERGSYGRDLITKRFRRLAERLGLRHRCYDLRRTFATVAASVPGEPDDAAIRLILGHVEASGDMLNATYVRRFPDERLRRVSDHVRLTLFGPAGLGDAIFAPPKPIPRAAEPSLSGEVPPQQRRVLSIIAKALEATGQPPTFDEIAEEIGRRKSTVSHHVGQLEARGLIVRDPGRRRSIRLAS